MITDLNKPALSRRSSARLERLKPRGGSPWKMSGQNRTPTPMRDRLIFEQMEGAIHVDGFVTRHTPPHESPVDRRRLAADLRWYDENGSAGLQLASGPGRKEQGPMAVSPTGTASGHTRIRGTSRRPQEASTGVSRLAGTGG